MDLRADLERVDTHIVQRRFTEAEVELQRIYQHARHNDDSATLDIAMQLFVQLYCTMEPPDVGKAENFALQREQVNDTGYTKLQTALLLFHVVADYPRAISKLREAIERSGADRDDETLYASLSLLGQALLKLRRGTEAIGVLRQIEALVNANKPFVPGDETTFLEQAHKEGLEVERIKRIAAAVEPLCRDPQFKLRLSALRDAPG